MVEPTGPGLGGGRGLSREGGGGAPGWGDSPLPRSLPGATTNRCTETLGLSCGSSADRDTGGHLDMGPWAPRGRGAPTTTGGRGPAGSPPAPSAPPSGSSGVRADVATASRGRRAEAAADAGGPTRPRRLPGPPPGLALGAAGWHEVRANGARHAEKTTNLG